MASTVGVVGLGIMGGSFAKHLLDDGFDVVGYDPIAEKASRFKELGGRPVASPSAVADTADVVLTSLPGSRALLEVVGGVDGLADHDRASLVVVDLSTLPLDVKESAASLLSAGVLLDCPVSGTGSQAASRDISVYASGDAVGFERARQALTSISRSVHYLGEFGTGSKMKFVANHLVMINNLATAEAMHIASGAGLDLRQVVDVVSDGAGSSRIFEVRSPLMVDERYEPPTATMTTAKKDIAIISDFISSIHAVTPLFDAIRPFYEAGLAQLRDDQDPASLFSVLQGLAEPRTGDAPSEPR